MDDRETHRKEEMDHPKGALFLILVDLLSGILLWTHTYLRLWIKGMRLYKALGVAGSMREVYRVQTAGTASPERTVSR